MRSPCPAPVPAEWPLASACKRGRQAGPGLSVVHRGTNAAEGGSTPNTPRAKEKAQGTAQGPVPTPQEAAEAPGPGCTYRTWCSPGKQRGPPGPWASRPGGRARHPRRAARAPPGCPRHRGSRQHWRWGPAPGGGGWSLGRQSEPGTVTHADGHLPALTGSRHLGRAHCCRTPGPETGWPATQAAGAVAITPSGRLSV